MKKRLPAVALMPAAALSLVLASACGGPDESSTPSPEGTGTGATSSTGGASSDAGTTPSGVGGSSTSGGAAPGGTLGTGGPASGGAVATGGTVATGGGEADTGGTLATGGVPTSGGGGSGGTDDDGWTPVRPSIEDPEVAIRVAAQDDACTRACEVAVRCDSVFADVDRCRLELFCNNTGFHVDMVVEAEMGTVPEVMTCLDAGAAHMNCVAALDCTGYLGWWNEDSTPFPCSAEQSAEEAACAAMNLFGW